MNDTELLRRYVQEGSAADFAAIVAQHLDLVYSVARRHVESSALAEDIAQSVFIDLARNAHRIKPGAPLVAWLHLASRHAALNAARGEARRRAREKAAMELSSGEPAGAPASSAMNPHDPDWPGIAPLLDEAVESLNEIDRSAILLRFFENKSLREIGATLGVSEDTAQKRVSRALDRLRTFFVGRGVAIGSTAFATTLSTHAVQTAPAGLAASISSSAAALPTAAMTAAKHLAMTTAQKTFASIAVVAALGFALHESLPAFRLRAEMQAGRQQLAALADTTRQLRLEQTTAARELAALNQGRSATPRSPEAESDAALAREAAAWTARIARLKQIFAQHPEQAIPELQLLGDHEWILATHGEDFSNEANVRQSLIFLRTSAKDDFLDQLMDATRKHLATARAFPDRFDQLAPLFERPLDPAILARYDFQRDATWLTVAEKPEGAVDPDRLAVAIFEYTGAPNRFNGYNRMETQTERSVREAVQSYIRSHDGARPASASQLLPLLAQPMDPAALEKALRTLPAMLKPTSATRR